MKKLYVFHVRYTKPTKSGDDENDYKYVIAPNVEKAAKLAAAIAFKGFAVENISYEGPAHMMREAEK